MQISSSCRSDRTETDCSIQALALVLLRDQFVLPLDCYSWLCCIKSISLTSPNAQGSLTKSDTAPCLPCLQPLSQAFPFLSMSPYGSHVRTRRGRSVSSFPIKRPTALRVIKVSPSSEPFCGNSANPIREASCISDSRSHHPMA